VAPGRVSGEYMTSTTGGNHAKKLEEKLREDFGFFLFMIWKHLQLPKPTALQYDIGHYLQHGPTRMVIEAFRGCGKSFVTAAFVIWLLYRDPQVKIMVVSASKERADAFSSFVKRLIGEVDFLQHLKPRKGQRDSLIAFDVGPALVDQSPSVKSVGINGQLTGSRANVIIGDDVEIPNNSYTQDSRNKLAESVKEFDAVLKPYDPHTMKEEPRIIFLGTPQTEMSLYNVMGERGYETRIWPILYPSQDQIIRYRGALAPFIINNMTPSNIGQSTEPIRFTMADIESRRLSYGKAGFALQFMLDTSLSDADKYPLKLADLVVMDVGMRKAPVEFTKMNGPETVIESLESVGLGGDRYYRPYWVSKETQEYTGAVMAIDPSGRGKDETSWAISKMYAGNIFIPEVDGTRDGYSDVTLEMLARRAKTHKVNMILIESNFGDGMFAQLLRPWLSKIYPCTIEDDRASSMKEGRIIDTLEPVMMQHRLVMDPKVIQKDLDGLLHDKDYSLFYQMSRIMNERGALKHDDRIDVLAAAVQYWLDQLDTDSHTVEAARKAIEMELFLQQHVVGYETESQTWMETW